MTNRRRTKIGTTRKGKRRQNQNEDKIKKASKIITKRKTRKQNSNKNGEENESGDENEDRNEKENKIGLEC